MISLFTALVLAGWPSPELRFDVRDDGTLEVLGGANAQRLSLTEAHRDGWSCIPLVHARARGSVMNFERTCAVRERFTRVPAGLEHELFVDERPPGDGPLRLRLSVDAPWRGDVAGDQHFGAPGEPGWQYGAAFLLRGRVRVPLETRRVAGGLELVVPEAELNRPDAFPLHIDPLVRGQSVVLDPFSADGISPADSAAPAVAWSHDGRSFLAVWEDNRRAPSSDLNTDLFGALIDVSPDGGGRWNLARTDVGPQMHPVVVQADGGFLVAWEDRGLADEVKVGFVARPSTSGVSATLQPLESVPQLFGGALSLAVASGTRPQVIVYAPTRTPTAVSVVLTDGTTLFSNVDAGFVVRNTAVAVTPNDVFFGATDGVQNSVVWKNGVVLSSALGGDELGLATDPNNVFISVRNPAVVGPAASVQVFSVESNFTLLSTLSGSFEPSWTLHQGKATLGVLQSNTLSVRQTTFASPLMQVSLPNPALDLALASNGSQLIGVWTEGRLGTRSVQWSFLPTLAPKALALTGAPLRRLARVAFDGDRALVVWVSDRQLKGQWLLRTATNDLMTATSPFVIGAELVGTRIGALDVTVLRTGEAVVAWSADTLANGNLIRTQRRALNVTTTMASTNTAVGAFVTQLELETNGSTASLAWLENRTVKAMEVGVGLPTDLFDAATSVVGFDLACLANVAQCTVIADATIGVRIIDYPDRVPTSLTRVLTGTGPVAATSTDNGIAVAFVRSGTVVVTGRATVDTALGSFPVVAQPKRLVLAGSPLVLGALDESVFPSVARVGLVSEGTFTVTQPPEALDFDLALSAEGPLGVVAVTRDEPPKASTTVGLTTFTLLPVDAGMDAGVDAGLVDAGVDAGAPDAGPSLDAGLGDGGLDGGTTGGQFVASGCACDALGGAWVTWVLFVWALRRRR